MSFPAQSLGFSRNSLSINGLRRNRLFRKILKSFQNLSPGYCALLRARVCRDVVLGGNRKRHVRFSPFAVATAISTFITRVLGTGKSFLQIQIERSLTASVFTQTVGGMR